MKKKTEMMGKLALFLTVVLLFSSCVVPVGSLASVEPTPEETLTAHLAVNMGDVNGDAGVNAKDALAVLQFSVNKLVQLPGGFTSNGASGVSFEGDLSADGKINAKDALQILKITVGKEEAYPSFLEVEEFSSAAYPLTTENYIPMQVIHTGEDLGKAGLPQNILAQMQNNDFENHSYIVFSDAVASSKMPKAVQVALYQNNALVRYEYSNAVDQASQYLVAVAVPKNVGQQLQTVYATPINKYIHIVKPSYYTLEYPLENRGDSYSRMFVLKTRDEALAFAEKLKDAGLLDRAMEQFLFYRAECNFFSYNQLVVWCDYGVQANASKKMDIQSVLVEGKTATFVAVGEENNSGEEGKMRFRMQLLDVPQKMMEGCEEFIVTNEVPMLQPARSVAYQQKETKKGGSARGEGSPWFVTNANYIDSAEALAEYCKKNISNLFLQEQYAKEYFETKSLLVFNGKPKSSGEVENTVTAINMVGDELVVALSQSEYTGLSTDEFYNNFCVVEVDEKLNGLEGIRFSIAYQTEGPNEQGDLETTYMYGFDYRLSLEK